MQSTGQTSIHASHPVQPSARMTANSLGSFFRAFPAPLAMMVPRSARRGHGVFWHYQAAIHLRGFSTEKLLTFRNTLSSLSGVRRTEFIPFGPNGMNSVLRTNAPRLEKRELMGVTLLIVFVTGHSFRHDGLGRVEIQPAKRRHDVDPAEHEKVSSPAIESE